jgi:uncharacterized protein (DUF305 family)
MKRMFFAALGVAAIAGVALAQTNQGVQMPMQGGHAAPGGQAMPDGPMMQGRQMMMQGMMMMMQGGQMMMPGAGNAPAYAKPWSEGMGRMQSGMMAPLTGDADVDFARGMIPHHQGAIDMARIQLDHGIDPEIRKLAEGVIAAQEAEIVVLREWLAKRGY